MVFSDRAKALHGFVGIGEYFECIGVDDFHFNRARIEAVKTRYHSFHL